MLRAVLIVAAVMGAAVPSGAVALTERPDAPAISALDQGTLDRDDVIRRTGSIDRDDFDGGNGNGVIDRDDFDGGNGGDGANG